MRQLEKKDYFEKIRKLGILIIKKIFFFKFKIKIKFIYDFS